MKYAIAILFIAAGCGAMKLQSTLDWGEQEAARQKGVTYAKCFPSIGIIGAILVSVGMGIFYS